MRSSKTRSRYIRSGVLLVSLLLSACAQGSSSGIDDQLFIDVGDTTLHAEIRGREDAAQVLLYLHGGPGSPLGVPIFRAYGGHLLEESFVVVYLHQRGIMKSPRIPDDAHSIENHVEDVHHVVQTLEREYPERKISLLGHSWGGVLAYLYLEKHPRDIHKLITVAAPVNAETMTHGRVEMILQWARETGNEEAIRDLSPLKDKSVFEHTDDFKILAKWSPKAYGGWARNLSRERIDDAIDYEKEIPAWLGEQKQIEELMLMDLLRLDLSDAIEKIHTPLLCIVGKDDVNVPWRIVQQEIEAYGGPVEFRLFENSHHMPFIDEEGLFVETVTRFLGSE
jgi:proline iminopeptidase